MTSRHEIPYRMLKGLMLGRQDEIRMEVNAAFLDEAQDRLLSAERDSWPDTTTMLAEWEQAYALDSSGTDAERRERILWAIRRAGGLSKEYMAQLASDLGYAVTILGGEIYPFRAGVSATGDPARVVNGAVAAYTYPEGGVVPDPPEWDAQTKGPYPADFWIVTIVVDDYGQHDDISALRQAILATKAAGTTIAWDLGDAEMAKSKHMSLPTPTAADNVGIMRARVAGSLVALHAILSGTSGGSVTFSLYKAAARNAGSTGTLVATGTVSDYDDGASIDLTTASLSAGDYVYLVVASVVGSPTFLELDLAYIGGD